MFSRTDAEALRKQLTPIDLYGPQTDQTTALTAYRRHYGIDADSLGCHHSHRIGTFPSGDYLLTAQHFELPEAGAGTAFLLHGYYDHAGLYGHLIRQCLALGYSVVIMDLPGHGLSSGKPASIGSFEEYSEALEYVLELAAKLPRPWLGIGQSTGCAVIMDSLLNRKLDERFGLAQYVLLCPLLYPVGWSLIRYVFYLTRSILPEISRSFARNSHDDGFLRFLREHDCLQARTLPADWIAAMVDYQQRFAEAAQSKVPVQIIQGTDDGTVDWQKNLPLIREKFPAGCSHLLNHAKHHLVNESAVFQELLFARLAGIINSEPARVAPSERSDRLV